MAQSLASISPPYVLPATSPAEQRCQGAESFHLPEFQPVHTQSKRVPPADVGQIALGKRKRDQLTPSLASSPEFADTQDNRDSPAERQGGHGGRVAPQGQNAPQQLLDTYSEKSSFGRAIRGAHSFSSEGTTFSFFFVFRHRPKSPGGLDPPTLGHHRSDCRL